MATETIGYYDFRTGKCHMGEPPKPKPRRHTYTYTDLDGVAHKVERTAYGWDVDHHCGYYTFDRLREAKAFIVTSATKEILGK